MILYYHTSSKWKPILMQGLCPNSYSQIYIIYLFKCSQILKLNDLHEFQIALFMHDFIYKKLL